MNNNNNNNNNNFIDFKTMPNNVPSLCIPRVFSNIDEKRVRNIFNDLNVGNIKRIDIISKITEKGEKFNRIFIHFNEWFSNENANTSRERLLNGKEIKIIYDEPWFWKVSAYRDSINKSKSLNKNHHVNPKIRNKYLSKSMANNKNKEQLEDKELATTNQDVKK
jgi:hypothetical protein